MSDEEQVIDLLDRAVATVPPALLPAPHAAIRRRVRRRRATGWGAAALAALVVLAGFAVVRQGPAVGLQEPAASAAPPDPSVQAAPGVPWLGARIDRTGTRITVFAAPLLGKCVERDPAGDELVLGDDRVWILLDGTYTGCGDDTQVAFRTFTLPQSIGDRFLVDRRSPSGQPFVFSDKDMPDLAAGGWSEVQSVWYGAGAAALQLNFTRPGGPDLRVMPVRYQPEPDGRLTAPDHTLLVGGRQIDVYDRAGSLSAGWWSSNQDVRFTLEVAGGPIEKSAFDEILRGMTWA